MGCRASREEIRHNGAKTDRGSANNPFMSIQSKRKTEEKSVEKQRSAEIKSSVETALLKKSRERVKSRSTKTSKRFAVEDEPKIAPPADSIKDYKPALELNENDSTMAASKRRNPSARRRISKPKLYPRNEDDTVYETAGKLMPVVDFSDEYIHKQSKKPPESEDQELEERRTVFN